MTMSDTRSLFDGDGDLEDDGKDDRLKLQIVRVYEVMMSRLPYTLDEIAHRAHAPEASVSARLRDLAKPRFGAHVITKRQKDGLYWYCLVELGDASLVYNPVREPHSAKREARARVTAYLDHMPAQHYPISRSYSPPGERSPAGEQFDLLVADLRELLK